jgi:hypothetical protein
VGASGLDVSSVETETEAPSFAESRVQTEKSLYEFYSVTAGAWVMRESVYDFDERYLHAKNTPYDCDDPFMTPEGLGTVVGGDIFDDGTTLQGDNAMDDEKVEDAPPVPQTFVADDGQVYATEEEMLERNKYLAGCRLLPMRSRSINRSSHTSSRGCESRSPIRPPR